MRPDAGTELGLWDGCRQPAPNGAGSWEATHLAVYRIIAVAGVDEDGTAYGLTGRLQQQVAAVGEVCHDLHRGDVFRVLAQIEELAQRKVCGEACVIEILVHGSVC